MLFGSESEVLSAAAVVAVGGVLCLWVASKLRIPSILLLLPTGVILGPGLGILRPDEQFGDVLFPVVSLGVGVLLFEGGLSLRLDRVGEVRTVVGRLVTVGALVVWAIGGVTVYLLFDVTRGLAALIAALLVVSGPTVVQPLLRLAKPRPGPAEVLRWEGIVIDPIGATLAVVMLDAFLESSSPAGVVTRIVVTLAVGIAVGGALGTALTYAIGRHLAPDQLHNPIALAAAVGAFALADLVRPEAGLMATTVLGLVLANQRRAPSRHIREFEEEVGSLVLGGLFLVLGALIDLDDTMDVLPQAVVLTVVLIVIARPAAVYVSTVGSSMTTRERAFLCFVAPRGIVAAAVSAVFALEIEEVGLDPGPLVPVIFAVIVLTVVFYGFTAVPAAKYLRVARPEPEGVAIVGAERWHLEVANQLQDAGLPVLIFTDSEFERRRARQSALLVFDRSLDGEDVEEAAEALGIRSVLVLSDRMELSSAVINALAHVVGRANIYAAGDSGGLDGAGVGAMFAVRHAPGFTEEVIADLKQGATLAIRESVAPAADADAGAGQVESEAAGTEEDGDTAVAALSPEDAQRIEHVLVGLGTSSRTRAHFDALETERRLVMIEPERDDDTAPVVVEVVR